MGLWLVSAYSRSYHSLICSTKRLVVPVAQKFHITWNSMMPMRDTKNKTEPQVPRNVLAESTAYQLPGFPSLAE